MRGKPMKRIKHYNLTIILIMFSLVFMAYPGIADDTCVFSITADDIPPNITLLLDNGAEMEQVVWHSAYDNSIDYTPSVGSELDVVETPLPTTGTLTLTNITCVGPGTCTPFQDNKTLTGHTSGATAKVNGTLYDTNKINYDDKTGNFLVGEPIDCDLPGGNDGLADIVAITETGGGNGFFRDAGYGIIITGGEYYLVEVPSSLDLADYNFDLKATSSDAGAKEGTWEINERTITLPAQPSTVAVDGVIDNATYFRYSKNYLNWLFFAQDAGGSPLYDGSALPNQTRFYYAKKAIMTVVKGTGYQANFGIYYFSNDAGGSQAQPLMFGVQGDGSELTPNFKNNINNR